ncbi:MAG: nitroreductase [Bacteroidales bacterium]|nr:nitroreductase [Bacteroidales bacterium]
MANQVIESLLSRRSCRGYDPERIPPREVLDQILEVGEAAPTGRGSQSPIIIEITDRATRDRLSVLNGKILGVTIDPFYGAPVVLAVLADRNVHTHVYDGSLVMGNLMQAAHALGIDSCWIHRCKEIFDLPEGKELLKKWGVEGDYEGIGFCILGYGIQEPFPPKPRKANYVYHV